MNIWVCIGSGPSLTAEDVEFCRQQGWNLATCNMGYKIAPDAKVFHAMDSAWWELVGDDCLESLGMGCEVWCGSVEYASSQWDDLKAGRTHRGVNHLSWDGGKGYCEVRGHCHSGKLSGLQLINIVGWHQPELVILLGYDNQHTNNEAHWHHDYPEGMRNDGTTDVSEYAALWASAPFPIVNASRETNIERIPRSNLYDIPAIIEAKNNASRQTPQILDSRGNAIRH